MGLEWLLYRVAHFSWDVKHTIRTRWLANLNQGRSPSLVLVARVRGLRLVAHHYLHPRSKRVIIIVTFFINEGAILFIIFRFCS